MLSQLPEQTPQLNSAMPLTSLHDGERGMVIRIAMGSKLRLRLREMGFIPNVVVEVVRSAPLADPIEYRIKGYYITLRRQEAKDIIVKRINGKGKRRRFRFGWGNRH
jgi:ferrous iron transport protein A